MLTACSTNTTAPEQAQLTSPAVRVTQPEPAVGPVTATLFEDRFEVPDGLLTNEYAFWNPRDPAARWSNVWAVTSGSAFVSGGRAWTGRVDDQVPDVVSSNGTNSATFRMTTLRTDFRDVAVAFDLELRECSTTPSTPPTEWDGVHVFLRRQSDQHLYYASVSRRDGRLAIKKKVPGGPSNGGTYYTLAMSQGQLAERGTATPVAAAVQTMPDGSVQISVLRPDGSAALTAVDSGTGGAPITSPGSVGLRGDNCEFFFDEFRVRSIG